MGADNEISLVKEQLNFTEKEMAVLTVLCISFLIGGLIWVIRKTIDTPLQRIIGMTRDIAEGEGDLTRRLDESGKDELGELSHWFNVFIKKLQVMISETTGSADQLASASEDAFSH